MITLIFSHTTIDGSGNASHYFDIDYWEPVALSHPILANDSMTDVFLGPQPGGYSNTVIWDAAGPSGPFGATPYDTLFIQNILFHHGYPQAANSIWRHLYLPDGPTYITPGFRPRYTGILPGMPDDIATRFIPLDATPVPAIPRHTWAIHPYGDVFDVSNTGDKKINSAISPPTGFPIPTAAQVGTYNYAESMHPTANSFPYFRAPWSRPYTCMPQVQGYNGASGSGTGSDLFETPVSLRGYVVNNPEFFTYPHGSMGANVVPYRLYNIMLPTGHYDLGGEVDAANVIHDSTV